MTKKNEIRTQTRTQTREEAQTGVGAIVEGVHSSQEAVVDVARSCVDTVANLIPDLWNRPMTEGRPTTLQDVTDAAFEITHKVIDAQRDITHKVTGAR